MKQSQIGSARKLRVFAVDPSIGKLLHLSHLNEIILSIPWAMENRPYYKPFWGPSGEYLEVVDVDPASGLFYKPINLNDPSLLASNGLSPTESNPRFHQQMVYAVTMDTIAQFEEALGRVVLWSPRVKRGNKHYDDEYVGQLRVYPHGVRDANAYYSPEKKALIFGYFEADDRHPNIAQGSIIFSCLSHDIIVHEATHAILDGIHARFTEASNSDVLAFHEAFADIVALFKHFSHPEVLVDQISAARGNLETDNLLGQLAQEFGRALGRGGALRDALGEMEDGIWKRKIPNKNQIRSLTSPHGRGAILVAAIFQAFLEIYKSRTADLFRIATRGSGIHPPGALHPDLVKRLSDEAAKSARHILRICIRGLDYCPPVDVTFGDYLRAIITADHDLYPEDEKKYRIAIIEAFVSWGLTPKDLRIVSEETLVWKSLDEISQNSDLKTELAEDLGTLIENPEAMLIWIEQNAKGPSIVRKKLEEIAGKISKILETTEFPESTRVGPNRATSSKYSVQKLLEQNLLSLGLKANREAEWWAQKFYCQLFWAFITSPANRELLSFIGLTMDGGAPQTVSRSELSQGLPSIEVHSVRMAARLGVRNQIEREYVVEITQRRRAYFDRDIQSEQDESIDNDKEPDFIFRRGCTLLIDAATFKVRRVIPTKGNIADNTALARQRSYLSDVRDEPKNAFNGGSADLLKGQAFSELHRVAGD
jgi:hypothetical protein